MDRACRYLILLVLVIISFSTVISITEDDKAYYDQLNQKTIAQLTSKIDTQTKRIEEGLKNNFDSAKSEIQTEMNNQIKSNLMSIAIGLAGIIIITLAIFKVIDLKISSTRNIKKYENLLQTKAEELNKLILSATMERNELSLTRQQLMEYQGKLQEWQRNLQAGKDIPKEEFTLYKPPMSKDGDKKPRNWKVVMYIIGILLLLVAGVLVVKYFFG